MGNGKIFISYRREDTSGESGRLKDELDEVFGKNNIIYDLEFRFDISIDQQINEVLDKCKVVLVLIGNQWLSSINSKGEPRILQEDDFVRKEISAALKKGIHVIPILINGASMPYKNQITDELINLTERHAYHLGISRWKSDLNNLINTIKKVSPEFTEVVEEKRNIFISHRHSDTQSDCHRLKKDLQEIFGAENVFLDFDNITPGKDFANEIEFFLKKSRVVLVVIGPDWFGEKDKNGMKRIFKPNDWVRREVALALNNKNTWVIPVLMKNAHLPNEDDLPEEIKPLTRLQSTEITLKRWDFDVSELINVLKQIISV